MSSGEVRKVSRQDVQLGRNILSNVFKNFQVQNLIERCLQLYMNQKEVVDTLSFQAKIEPSFTELVWQKLEEENREFFKAYHIRLILKNQILLFNKLLEKQVELMQKACSSEVAILPIPNASNSPLLQTPSCYMSQHASASSRPDGMFYNGDFSSALVNGRSSEHQGNYLGSDSSIVAGIMHASTSVVSANSSNMGRISGLSETIIKWIL
ncbi:plant-specific domain TIGR01589 family protein [Musa troglodytarum]|uniref:Plant-specific domain TIGR01589 family protein n=1 Tax=Musa troglodytarum TaxID=320322 RepID=A0A9E7EA81_9LILI|nr:plant-specific domain TIGR01589 family protein [Musa troglodytarum]URD73435.1 plant-specific domain TIGR01589 family protein [Musa troglodytarum]